MMGYRNSSGNGFLIIWTLIGFVVLALMWGPIAIVVIPLGLALLYALSWFDKPR